MSLRTARGLCDASILGSEAAGHSKRPRQQSILRTTLALIAIPLELSMLPHVVSLKAYEVTAISSSCASLRYLAEHRCCSGQACSMCCRTVPADANQPGSLSPSPGVAAAEQALQAIADLCQAGRDPAKAPALPSVLRQCALLATQCLDGAAPLAECAV